MLPRGTALVPRATGIGNGLRGAGLASERSTRRYWLLGKPGIMRILAILYEHGPMPLHHVPRYGMGVGTTYRSAREAAMLGLVELYYCGTSKCVRLTPQGSRVAGKLAELLAVLEEIGLAEPLTEKGDGAGPHTLRRERISEGSGPG